MARDAGREPAVRVRPGHRVRSIGGPHAGDPERPIRPLVEAARQLQAERHRHQGRLTERVLIDGLDIVRFNPCIYGICIDYYTTEMPRLDLLNPKQQISRFEVFPYGIIDWDRFHVRIAFLVDELRQTCGQSGQEKIHLEAILSGRQSRCSCKLSVVEGLNIFNPLLQ